MQHWKHRPHIATFFTSGLAQDLSLHTMNLGTNTSSMMDGRKLLIQKKRVIMCKCQNVNDLLARQAGILEYDECATQKMK